MAENKPGVMIYFETLQAIDALDAEDTKQIVGAILRYAKDGEAPEVQGTLAAFWLLIQSSLDRDGNRYNTRRMRGLWLTYCRECKKSKTIPLSFEEWEQQAVNGSLSCVQRTVEQFVDTPSPSTTTSSTPTTASSASTSTTSPSSAPATKKEYRGGVGESKPPVPDRHGAPSEEFGAAAPTSTGAVTRHKYGEYGWVRLSAEEYDRLLNELGEAELTRCITYVDESAQSNGNKNKWKDWNLVIRKCARDRWGMSKGGQQSPGARPSASAGAVSDLQALHELFGEDGV